MKVRQHGHTWIPLREAAAELAVTRRHIYRLVASGSLIAQRAANATWIQLASLNTYRAQRGTWNPGGVEGGRAAAEAAGVKLPWLGGAR